jgi:hypothetical protein
VRAHLRRPETFPCPPELSSYRLERWFCERFNVPGDPLPLWPAQKIADYATIMIVEAEVEAEQQRSAAGANAGSQPSAAGPPRPAATQDSYQRLRAQATPPPMPPA